MNINTKIYEKFDRRQNNQSVDNDRRSGNDRRFMARLDDKTRNDIDTVMRLIPPTRKLRSSYEEGKSGDWIYCAAMAFRLINEFKEDWHDVKTAIKGGEDKYVDFQHPFWATKGSLIDEHFGKNKIVSKLSNKDLTLYDLKSVKKFLKKIGMTGFEEHKDFIKIRGNWYSQVIGRATLRVPIQGIALFMIMNTKSIYDAENKPKEILKSFIRMACIMGLSAVCGSLGKPSGKLVEMPFMGLGIIYGINLANKINSRF